MTFTLGADGILVNRDHFPIKKVSGKGKIFGRFGNEKKRNRAFPAAVRGVCRVAAWDVFLWGGRGGRAGARGGWFASVFFPHSFSQSWEWARRVVGVDLRIGEGVVSVGPKSIKNPIKRNKKNYWFVVPDSLEIAEWNHLYHKIIDPEVQAESENLQIFFSTVTTTTESFW